MIEDSGNNEISGVFRGLLFAVPVGLLMWAIIIVAARKIWLYLT